MPSTRSPRIPAYRHHKPSGQAVVRLNGHDIYLGKHDSPGSHAAYRRAIAEWLAAGREGFTSGTDNDQKRETTFTINELFLAYWAFAQSYYVKNGKPTGELANVRDAARPLTKLYGTVPVIEFGPRALEVVRQTMIDRGLCRKVINGRINRIRRIVKWGVSKQFVSPLILQGLQALPPLKKGRCNVRESEGVKPVPDDHVDAVLAHVTPQVTAMIELQRLTGMRPGEVVIMRGRDLDTTGRLWGYRPESHKTEHHGRERLIYLGPKAQRILRPWLKADLQAFLFSPEDAMMLHRKRRSDKRRTPRSCGNRRGTNCKARPRKKPGDRYTTMSYARAIADGCARAFAPPQELARQRVAARGRKANSSRWETLAEWRTRLGPAGWKALKQWERSHRWSPNQLRHNAATFLRKEYGIDAARVILGHSTPAVTEVYAELDHAKAMQIMAEVG